MPNLTNAQMRSRFKDFVEEFENVDLCCEWEKLEDGVWRVKDSKDNILGHVSVRICQENGCMDMIYRYNKNLYSKVPAVPTVMVNANNLSDAQERQKFIDFDCDIADAHGISTS